MCASIPLRGCDLLSEGLAQQPLGWMQTFYCGLKCPKCKLCYCRYTALSRMAKSILLPLTKTLSLTAWWRIYLESEQVSSMPHCWLNQMYRWCEKIRLRPAVKPNWRHGDRCLMKYIHLFLWTCVYVCVRVWSTECLTEEMHKPLSGCHIGFFILWLHEKNKKSYEYKIDTFAFRKSFWPTLVYFPATERVHSSESKLHLHACALLVTATEAVSSQSHIVSFSYDSQIENFSWDWEPLKYCQALKKQYGLLNETKTKALFHTRISFHTWM